MLLSPAGLRYTVPEFTWLSFPLFNSNGEYSADPLFSSLFCLSPVLEEEKSGVLTFPGG